MGIQDYPYSNHNDDFDFDQEIEITEGASLPERLIKDFNAKYSGPISLEKVTFFKLFSSSPVAQVTLGGYDIKKPKRSSFNDETEAYKILRDLFSYHGFDHGTGRISQDLESKLRVYSFRSSSDKQP